MRENILSFIKELISEKTGKAQSEINADTKLQELEIDSMAVLDIVFDLEHEFDVSFPDNLGNLQTLNDIVDLTINLKNQG